MNGDPFSCDIANPVVSHFTNFISLLWSDPDATQFEADNFDLIQKTVIDQVCWFGGYDPSNTPTGNDNFSIVYYKDNGGLPGAEIIRFTGVSILKKQLTGNTIIGYDEYGYYTKHQPVMFDPGKYWISIINDTSDDPDDDWSWATSSDGDFFHVVSPDESNWGGSTFGGDFAFILGEAQVIPTISQWGIFVLSLCLAIFGVIAVKQKQMAITY